MAKAPNSKCVIAKKRAKVIKNWLKKKEKEAKTEKGRSQIV